VYARRAPDGTWSSFFCDPIAPLDQAGEGLAFGRGLARDSRRGGWLFGLVSIAERAGDAEVGIASPLNGVTVAIKGEKGAFSTATDSRGQYELKDVPPGRYTLSVSASPGVDPLRPATIEIKGPGACVQHSVTAMKRPPK
jgi:hypothetical protein